MKRQSRVEFHYYLPERESLSYNSQESTAKGKTKPQWKALRIATMDLAVLEELHSFLFLSSPETISDKSPSPS